MRIGTRKLWDRVALDRWVDGLARGAAPLTADDWLQRLDIRDARQDGAVSPDDAGALKAAWIERRGRLAAWRAAGRPLPGDRRRKKPPASTT